jgi:hypothetical protein
LAFLALTIAAAASHATEAPAPPDAAARPTSIVTFYGHVFGVGAAAPMPANTQFPVGEASYGVGGGGPCTTAPGASAAGVPTCDDDPTVKLVLYSTAGFVQISDGEDFTRKGGYAALHNEHGSTKDVLLDTTQPVTASVFLTEDTTSWFVGAGETFCFYPNPPDTGCLYPYWGWDAGAFPDAVVKASLYYAVLGEYGADASQAPPVLQAMQGGGATLVASGKTYVQLVTNGLPGSPNVREYKVDLGAPKVERIPKEATFFLVYSFAHESAGTAWGTLEYRVWSGEFFPPRFTLPVKNAFDVEQVVPQFLHGKLALLATINTPWGSYDVNPEATRLTITDERGNVVEPARIETIADYRVAHGAHYKPVNVSFVWDYLADKLPAGAYRATVEAGNHQGSARAACTATFAIGPGGDPAGAQAGLCGLRTDARFQNPQAKGDGHPDASMGGGPPALRLLRS